MPLLVVPQLSDTTIKNKSVDSKKSMVESESFEEKNPEDESELIPESDPEHICSDDDEAIDDGNSSGDVLSSSRPVVAEVMENSAVETPSNGFAVRDKQKLLTLAAEFPTKLAPVDLEEELQNMSATGGAVGGLVLGIWSIICSLITYFGFINAALAIMLGIYGLSSPRKRLAAIGIFLGICGLLMSLMEINQIVGDYFLDQEETADF